VAIILVIKREWLTKTLQEKKVKISLYTFYGIGLIGWLVGWLLGITDLLA
jgi:hypothetical protein